MSEREEQSSDREEKKHFDSEVSLFMGELRVTLPGVQILFAFLLSVPFTARFVKVSELARDAYYVGFLCAAVASAHLIAPAVYHRLHWRRDVVDHEQMLRSFNRLAVIGGGFLAVAMCAAVFLVTAFLFGDAWGAILALIVFLVVGWLWFVLPLAGKRRARVERAGDLVRPAR